MSGSLKSKTWRCLQNFRNQTISLCQLRNADFLFYDNIYIVIFKWPGKMHISFVTIKSEQAFLDLKLWQPKFWRFWALRMPGTFFESSDQVSNTVWLVKNVAKLWIYLISSQNTHISIVLIENFLSYQNRLLMSKEYLTFKFFRLYHFVIPINCSPSFSDQDPTLLYSMISFIKRLIC